MVASESVCNITAHGGGGDTDRETSDESGCIGPCSAPCDEGLGTFDSKPVTIDGRILGGGSGPGSIGVWCSAEEPESEIEFGKGMCTMTI